MSARHANDHASRDPFGLLLGWIWALGTALGFVCLAVSVDRGLGDQEAARSALTTPDAATPAAV